MILDELADRVEDGLRKIGRLLWGPARKPAEKTAVEPKSEPAAPAQPESPREECERLLAELADQKKQLKKTQEEAEALRERLAARQAEAALLPSQIENSLLREKSSQAFRQALELERLRKEIQEDQESLPRLEQACWSLEFRIRQTERKLQTRRALPRLRKSRARSAPGKLGRRKKGAE